MTTPTPELARKHWMAMWLDRYGKPRAWGVSPDKKDAIAIAMLELDAYKNRPAHAQEPPFTLKCKRIEATR